MMTLTSIHVCPNSDLCYLPGFTLAAYKGGYGVLKKWYPVTNRLIMLHRPSTAINCYPFKKVLSKRKEAVLIVFLLLLFLSGFVSTHIVSRRVSSHYRLLTCFHSFFYFLFNIFYGFFVWFLLSRLVRLVRKELVRPLTRQNGCNIEQWCSRSKLHIQCCCAVKSELSVRVCLVLSLWGCLRP